MESSGFANLFDLFFFLKFHELLTFTPQRYLTSQPFHPMLPHHHPQNQNKNQPPSAPTLRRLSGTWQNRSTQVWPTTHFSLQQVPRLPFSVRMYYIRLVSSITLHDNASCTLLLLLENSAQIVHISENMRFVPIGSIHKGRTCMFLLETPFFWLLHRSKTFLISENCLNPRFYCAPPLTTVASSSLLQPLCSKKQKRMCFWPHLKLPRTHFILRANRQCHQLLDQPDLAQGGGKESEGRVHQHSGRPLQADGTAGQHPQGHQAS